MAHAPQKTQTLSTHIAELRKRLLIIAAAFVAAIVVAYQFHEQIITILQIPLNETLYFTSPGGGFNFVLKVCMLVGFLAASPLILFQAIRFIEPALPPQKLSVLIRYLISSMLLLVAGVLFSYYVTLPAALRFLEQFGGDSLQALISANEYMNFVIAYLAGFGLLFQIPIIILFINRIKPIPPRALLRASRPVIIGAFVLAAILTPTADPINQGLMAGPIVGMYGLSTAMVTVSSSRHKRSERKQMRRSKQVHFSPPVVPPRPSAIPPIVVSPPSQWPAPVHTEEASVSMAHPVPQPALRQYLDLQPPGVSHASAMHRPAPPPLQKAPPAAPAHPPIPTGIARPHQNGPIFMDIRPA